MRNWILLIIVLVTATNQVVAQDIHFSQFYETTTLRNPALCGLFSGDYKVAVNYRSQWSSISKPFVTGQIALESRIPVNAESEDFISVGLLSYFDKAGSLDMKTIAFYPTINFSKKLEEVHNSYLTFGFTGGYLQRSFDPSKMTTNSQYGNNGYDPTSPVRENAVQNKINYFDVGAGINYSSSTGENNNLTYYVGLAGFHFTQPKTSFYNNELIRLAMKWNMNAGMVYRINDDYGLLLQTNLAIQGTYSEYMIGGMVNWKKGGENELHKPDFILYFGAYYRLNDALIPVVKLDYKGYSLGVSYDVNLSRLTTASHLKGGMELSLISTGLFKDPKWNYSRTSCPQYGW